MASAVLVRKAYCLLVQPIAAGKLAVPMNTAETYTNNDSPTLGVEPTYE